MLVLNLLIFYSLFYTLRLYLHQHFLCPISVLYICSVCLDTFFKIGMDHHVQNHKHSNILLKGQVAVVLSIHTDKKETSSS